MKQLGEILRNVNVAAFLVLALACAHQWRKRTDASIRWATLAFGSLAMIGVIGLFLRSSPSTDFAGWFIKTVLVVLILFPFFLYRFATAFQRPTRAVAVTVYVSTALVVAASVALPYLPQPNAPSPLWWTAYRLGVLVQWSVVFSIVAARLWVASRREASVVRRRMRTLALAAAGLNGVILVSGVGPSTPTEPMIAATQGLSLVSAVLFFVGLAPPRWLVTVWRRPEQMAFQGAMGALFQAETQGELSAVLLPRAAALVGASSAALVSTSGAVLASHGATDAQLEGLLAGGATVDGQTHRVRRIELRAGTLVLWTSHYAPFFGPDEFAMTEGLSVFADIVMDRCALADQQRRAETALTYQATHDGLTGLPNRLLLEDRVSQALARARRADTRVAVLFLDVDRFKVINDSLGHAVGDELLKAVAQRLRDLLRPEDTIARFGGDEFVVVTESWSADDTPELLAARLASGLARPLHIEGADVVVTVSIGVAVAGADYDTGALLRDADAAMYQAKAQGRDRCVIFGRAMREAADKRLETEGAIRRALRCGELRVHYQPMLEVASGRLMGVEALVRWQKDENTLILPDDFIPVAEETGLIIELGATVLREACRQVATWHREGPALDRLSLSVNLSARELLNPGLVDQVRDAVTSAGLEPSHLCLEITESVLLDDTDSCARSLRALSALGIRIAVDDFGTGYSSLTYLKRLAVDILKIDQSFVAGLGAGASTQDRAIVAGVVDLANGFGLTTVAEGVETAEQLAQLNALGCGMAQGCWFCRPMSPADAAAWMRSRETGVDTTNSAEARAEFPDWTRVLVVDDQASVRDLMRWTLEMDERFRVVGEASGGREAVALARHYQPDLVILDLAMPGVGGLEALPLICAVAPSAQVVVLSGLDPSDVADHAFSAGAAGYLCKGADPARLLAELHEILDAPTAVRPAAAASSGSSS